MIALYVGADNDTGELDIPHVETIVGKRHDSFTVIPGYGVWHGMREDMVMVMIQDRSEEVMATAALLKSELRQDAIGWQSLPDINLM
jgi:hypothetical protein